MNKETKFKVGDKAHKPKGYKFPCTIVGVFETIAGEVRVIGEMDEYGLLHIFNENQLEHYGKDEPDLLNEAYKNYCLSYKDGHEFYEDETVKRSYTQQEFINKCKTDDEFSEKWGLTIEERELSLEERYELMKKLDNWVSVHYKEPKTMEYMDKHNIPTRAISLMWNQRSCDFPLGIPFNIASYGLLLEIIAKEVNMVPDELIGNLGDCHIYLNQIEGCKEQIGRKYTHEERTELLKQAMGEENYNKAVDELMPFGGGLSEYYDSYKIPYTTREPYKLPRLKFSPCPITGIDMEYQSIAQFQIENYESHPTIKYPLSN
jgi:hypothetical protein